MAAQSTLPGVAKSEAMAKLIVNLREAKANYGSAKNFARMAIEDPAGAKEAAQEAKALTEACRMIQTLA